MLYLFGEDQAQEDVLQVDEEVVGVDGPVLPRSETGHHSLLGRQKKISDHNHSHACTGKPNKRAILLPSEVTVVKEIFQGIV